MQLDSVTNTSDSLVNERLEDGMGPAVQVEVLYSCSISDEPALLDCSKPGRGSSVISDPWSFQHVIVCRP